MFRLLADASSSSNDSFLSSRQSELGDDKNQASRPDPAGQAGRSTGPLSQEPFLAVCPPGPIHLQQSGLPPVLESPDRRYDSRQAEQGQLAESHQLAESPAYLTRRGSDSSISLGGDAQSHKPSRAPSVIQSQKRARTTGGRNDGSGQHFSRTQDGTGYPIGSSGQGGGVTPGAHTDMGRTEWPIASPWEGVPASRGGALPAAGPSHLQRPISETSFHPYRPAHQHYYDHIHSLRATPQSHLRTAFSPAPVDHWRSPHVFASPYAGLATRVQPPMQSRLAPLSTLTSQGTPAQLPPATVAELPVVLERIQTSLTALHERINSIEYAQTMVLRQPANPWAVLLRIFGVGSSSGTDQRWEPYHQNPYQSYVDPGQRSGLVTRVVMRLLGTVRRTIVDASFVLVLMSLFVAVVAGIRGRGRGGRRALLQFWMTVMRRARAAGRSLQGNHSGV